MAAGGRPFGRYLLLDDLGRGGMAVVSRARMAGPKGFARTVVIKRILVDLAEQASFVEMLADEARLSAMLRHRAIVQVFEFGQVDGEYYLAMEFVDGIDLLDLLRACASRKVRLPIPVACHIVAEIAGALAYAHALTNDEGRPLEIVHRDVSPSNIMVTTGGEVKLLDFGIAKAASCVRDDHTATGTLKGKISYLSPEQADGMPIDRRTDIFALGIVLHETLTMQRLFRGGSDFETMRLIREARVEKPSSTAPGIPPELDALVLKMLARDPGERFASGDEVVEALTPITRMLHADAAALSQFLRQIGPTARRAVPARRPNPPPSPIASSAVSPAGIELPPPLVSSELPLLTPSARLRTQHRWPVMVVSALATMVAAVLWLARDTPLPRAHPSAPPAVPRAAPPVAAPAPHTTELPSPATVAATRVQLPERVRLVVTGTPGAEVLLDDTLIGTLPVDVRLPRHDGQRQIKVQAAGAHSYSRSVAADVDVSLRVNLQRLHFEPSHPKRSGSLGVIKDPFASP